MATQVELQARLDALRKARDTGALEVRHGDTRVVYRTMTEMERIISALEAEIFALAGNSTLRRKRRYIYQSGKGY